MRISDWSSDVCSSDLSQPHRVKKVTVGRVWSFRDITKRAFLEQELEHQATHDSLTNLPNRVLLNDRIQQAIAIAMRQKTHFAKIGRASCRERVCQYV